MSFLKRRLVHAQARGRLVRAPRQPALHRPTLDAVHLVPAQSQPACHGLDARLLQPVDHQRLEQRREPAARLRPRDLHLQDSVLRTLHPRHLRHQHRLQLARVQMPPAPLAAVVATARSLAGRTRQRRVGADLHDHPDLLGLQVQLYVPHRPRSRKVQDAGVQVAVSHAARRYPLPPPRPIPLSDACDTLLAPSRRTGLCWRATRAARRGYTGWPAPRRLGAASSWPTSPRPSRKPQCEKLRGVRGAGPPSTTHTTSRRPKELRLEALAPHLARSPEPARRRCPIPASARAEVPPSARCGTQKRSCSSHTSRSVPGAN